MANKDAKSEIYDDLRSEYIAARNNVGFHLLKLTLVVLEANKKLCKRSWSKWLKDPQINIKHTQAKKLITIAEKCKNDSQLTDLLNREGIEKTYLICQIKNDSVRNDMAEQIIDVPFTVKETKELIKKANMENIPVLKAIEEVKNIPKIDISKKERKTVPFEDFQKLQFNYETVLKENEELLKQLEAFKSLKAPNHKPDSIIEPEDNEQLNDINIPEVPEEYLDEEGHLIKPIESDLPENTVIKKRLSVITQGWELPVIHAHKNIGSHSIETLTISAVNRANNEFSLDLL